MAHASRPTDPDRTGELPHTDLPPRRVPYYDDDEAEGPQRRGSEERPPGPRRGAQPGRPGEPGGGTPPETHDPG